MPILKKTLSFLLFNFICSSKEPKPIYVIIIASRTQPRDSRHFKIILSHHSRNIPTKATHPKPHYQSVRFFTTNNSGNLSAAHFTNWVCLAEKASNEPCCKRLINKVKPIIDCKAKPCFVASSHSR